MKGYVTKDFKRKLFLYFIILTLTLALTQAVVKAAYTEKTLNTAVVLSIEPPWDTIDDGVKECFIEALAKAENEGKAFIYVVNSYGGLLDAGYTIGDAVRNSKTVTIAYVTSGKALSAATLIILPAHVIALHPNSIIGAMQPVMVNPTTGEVTFINESKIVKPIVEKAVDYALARGRNASLVSDFVWKAETINAEKAVKYGVADFTASSLEEALKVLENREVNVSGSTYRLKISNLERYQCSVRSRLISILENYTVLNILMTIGVLGTLMALLSGKLQILPLTLLFVLLGLIGSGFNPNLISLFLIILGGVLLAVELFVLPGFGIVGISGIILIAFGFALLPTYVPAGLMPSEEYLNTVRALVLTLTLVLGTFFGFVTFKLVKIRKKKPEPYGPIGKVGKALEDLKPGVEGFILLEGEYWRAISEEFIPKDGEVIVVDMIGSTLKVKKKS
ncbi:MAG: serine protease [Zestosphaera tikiterensis]|uniref:Serine protease n=1 Tax=Zestosphaera tikiterensis TaxID=1973259 RepID=A0A2R7Y7D4_9CREN|nr:MAG: serine protease [Zestosphaera tikiterensis]